MPRRSIGMELIAASQPGFPLFSSVASCSNGLVFGLGVRSMEEGNGDKIRL